MLNNKIVKIPFSFNEYFIDTFGNLVNSDNNEVPIITEDNKAYVEIDWIDGLKKYELPLILVISFFNIKIPASKFDKISIIFKDGNSLNTNLSNLSYKFKEPIESLDLKGFFYIPFYTDYVININGDIYSYKKNTFKKWHITKGRDQKNIKGGYFVCSATNDLNQPSDISRHRALCLVFKDCPGIFSDFVVNHKDGNPGNDILDNLEWVTYSENNQHAYDTGLIKNNCVKILCKKLDTNEILSFNSIATCTRSLNVSEGMVRYRLKNKGISYCDSLVFKEDDGSEWPEINVHRKNVIVKSIIARNIFTGLKTIFSNAGTASENTQVNTTLILDQCRNLDIIAISGFNFRFFERGILWPNHNEKHLRMYKENSSYHRRGVLLIDENGKEIKFFENIVKTSKAFNVSTSVIKRYCLSNKKINGIKFTFYKLTDNLGPPIK